MKLPHYIIAAALFAALITVVLICLRPRPARVHLRADKQTADLDTKDIYYYVPSFTLAATAPEQDGLQAKIGGLPWGFPPARWPHCAECGHAMSHLAQLPHVEGKMDLGKEDTVLHVFQCENDPGACGTWDYINESTRCIILDNQVIGEGLTHPPEEIPLIGEYRITDWNTGRTSQKLLDHPDAWYGKASFFALDEAVLDGVFSVDTKSQGVPHWTGNGPHGFPPPPFEYLAQFGTFIHCRGKIPTADEAGTIVRYNQANQDGSDKYVEPAERKNRARYMLQVSPDESGFYGDWANLGSDGTGYLFIDRTKYPAEAVWFWNR